MHSLKDSDPVPLCAYLDFGLLYTNLVDTYCGAVPISRGVGRSLNSLAVVDESGHQEYALRCVARTTHCELLVLAVSTDPIDEPIGWFLPKLLEHHLTDRRHWQNAKSDRKASADGRVWLSSCRIDILHRRLTQDDAVRQRRGTVLYANGHGFE